MHLQTLPLLLQEPCAGTLCLGAPADDVAKYINKNKAQWGVPANVTFQLCNMWNGSPLDQDRGGPTALPCTVSPSPALAPAALEVSGAHHLQPASAGMPRGGPLPQLCRSGLSAYVHTLKWLAATRLHAALSRDMLLAPLLDSGIRILFYQGDLDFIVNDQGTMVRPKHPSRSSSRQRCSLSWNVRSCKTTHPGVPAASLELRRPSALPELLAWPPFPSVSSCHACSACWTS
jgi:hypothetical protein